MSELFLLPHGQETNCRASASRRNNGCQSRASILLVAWTCESQKA